MVAVARPSRIALSEQRPRGQHAEPGRVAGLGQQRFERGQRGAERALPNERLRQPGRDVRVLGRENERGAEFGLGVGEVALGQEQSGEVLAEGKLSGDRRAASRSA
ncbi:hypothetical protein ACFQYP_58230 [Nonomuraea antimicrobica]